MRYQPSHQNIFWTVLFVILAALFLNGCGNVNDVASTTPPLHNQDH
jgi:hypothetical protein